jgi:DNA-binding MarR family transcriptional regulator
MRPRQTLDLELSSALRIPLMRLSRRLRAERSDLTLTLTQMAALSTLERHGPMTPTALAEHEHVQPPSITRVIAALEGRELVARQPHPSDGRQYVLALTKRGHSMLAEDRRRRDAWLERQLDTLSSAELESLKAAIPVLDRLSQA